MADIRPNFFLRAAEALTVAAFRAVPALRRRWLIATLRAYHGHFAYANFVAGLYLGGSPKLAYRWGMQSFFVPRVAPGARVLDVGCGRGQLAELVGERAAVVFAYDRELRVVREARRRSRRGNVLYFCGDAIDALPRGSFDIAILSSVLPFVRDAGELLRGLHAIVPEILVRETRRDRDFTVPLLRSLGANPKSDPHALREYDRDDLVLELERAGWRVRDERDTYDIYLQAVRA